MGRPLRSTAAVAAVVMTGTGITAASAQTAAEPTQPADAASSLVFNEVESNGDTTDWAELHNTGEEPIDLSGFHFRDDDDDHDYVLPDGSVIEPGGYFVIDQPLDGEAGFDFGLGDPDAARLFAADGSTLLASTSWQEHAETTYARCPDGTGAFRRTTASTKGAANDCSLPLVINEVSAGEESFIEILNIGSWEADLDDTQLISAAGGETDDSQELSGTLATGARTVVEGLELSSAEAVELVQDESTVLDAADWSAGGSAVAGTSWGRCPDGNGPFEQTLAATAGAINSCEGIAEVQDWPGGADVAVADDTDLVGEDGSSGTLSAVENDAGTVSRPSVLRYELGGDDGETLAATAGAINSCEGIAEVQDWPGGADVAVADDTDLVGEDGSSGTLSAVENDAGTVSRPSVLRYELGGDDGETLAATDEWNVAEDFEGLARTRAWGGRDLGARRVTDRGRLRRPEHRCRLRT